MMGATRTELLQLRERRLAVNNCTGILKGRRQALIKEFLALSQPLLRSREEIRAKYGAALAELRLSRILEGDLLLKSLAQSGRRPLEVRVAEKNLLGLRYRDVEVPESFVRSPNDRGYDYQATTEHLEETYAHFEELVDALCELARHEGKFRRLAEELVRLNRRIRVLEQRVMPRLQAEIKRIVQSLSERDREDFFRLKRFKQKGLRKKTEMAATRAPRTPRESKAL